MIMAQTHLLSQCWLIIIKVLWHFTRRISISRKLAWIRRPVFTWRQFWPSGIVVACVCVSMCVYQSPACPCDNSPLVHASITQFGVHVQKTLVKNPIVLGGDRPWHSKLNLTWKSNFTPFWACPHENLSPVQARIAKFGPEMHLSTVKISIVFGGDQPWPSSNLN